MTTHDVAITSIETPSLHKILTKEAQAFLLSLHNTFNARRLELLEKRKQRQRDINAGTYKPAFLHTRYHDANWKVAPTPKDLEKRWVEITGPTDRKMLINALNSGANVFMADFEDANSPTWENMVDGQQNLIEAIRGTLSFTSPEGKLYRLHEKKAVLLVRPRGWHLNEEHYIIGDTPISGSLFDFGLYFFHNAHALMSRGTGPYFYLPKLENHLEARLWNDVFLFAQQALSVPRGTIRATVLIETILAAFEMEEILYEIREHAAALNAGRWDYIFSIIKKFQNDQSLLFPDRSQITMTVPFMDAYANRVVEICHKRGAHAIGGMAAFIPSRRDAELNASALTKVREDKVREVAQGFDGTWVAHPDLVPVAHEVFEKALKNAHHQKNKGQKPATITEEQLLNFKIHSGVITEQGFRANISVTLQYLQAWLDGYGAVGINNLMEDVATAEISRSQLWQWVHHPHAHLTDGRKINNELYLTFADDEQTKIGVHHIKDQAYQNRLMAARTLLDHIVLKKEFTDFMTIPAYKELIRLKG